MRSVNLGLRFVPKVSGIITAIGFYKTGQSEGPYVASLSTPSGQVLSQAPFPRGSNEGWQIVAFSPGVRVSPGAEYIASYHAPNGCYAATPHYFDTAMDTELVTLPAGAGVYQYGENQVPNQTHLNAGYYVDVLFRPEANSSPNDAVATTTMPQPPQNPLDLPIEPWSGGPAYYSRFPKANAAGWSEPSFFPIAIFFGKPSHARVLKSLGINTYMAVEHDGSPISAVTNEGVFVLPSDEWTPSEVGDDPLAVGWHISDECEMGYSGCSPDPKHDNGEQGRLQQHREMANERQSLGDGRFLQANFGNGVLGTFWAPTTMKEHVALVDVTSVDKYAYTSSHVQALLRASPYWPVTRNPASAGTYGWLQKRMTTFSSPSGSKPNWVFVETARPNLTEVGASTIDTQQLEGAVWNAIINGATGIAYFQHNNDQRCGTYSLIECDAELRDKVKQVNLSISAMAPIINTPSLRWNLGPGLDAALKTHGDSTYIFAMTDGGQGMRRFNLPPRVEGTEIEVIGEGRTIPVINNSFQDRFTAEYDHHIYRIAIS